MEESARERRVNNLVGRFYRNAVSAPLERFREVALRDLGTLVPFDTALWGIGDPTTECFHSLTLLGLDERLKQRLERTLDLHPGFGELFAGDDEPIDAPHVIPEECLRQSAIHATVCQPFDVRHALAVGYPDASSRLHSIILLGRFDPDQPFDPEQRSIQKHLVFHMLNAMSLAFSVYLGGVCARDMGKSAAICDRFGVCYDIQPSFLGLVAEKFPGWDGRQLPFDLPGPEARASLSVRGLQVVVSPVGDLLCLQIWRQGPIDLLTERERQIVDSVCRGLSYKEVARPLGIAPSTVSNHLYRVFEKLGVSSRNELAKLVSRWRQLH